jgi:hypothetical protein
MNLQTGNDALNVFVTRLLEEKQMQDIDPEISEQLKADLTDRVEDRINMTILKNLPEEALPKFEQLLEKENIEETQAFCLQYIPNIQDLLSAELLAFRK